MTIKQKQNLHKEGLARKTGRLRGAKKSWWPIVNAVIYISVFIGGICYIAGINDLSIKGFKLQDMKTRAAAIESENANLELQITQIESYENLTARAREIGMVGVDKIDYISAVNGAVARK